MGTPDFLRDKKYLKFMYKDLLVLQHDFFQNVLYGVIFLRKRQELALVSPSEETRWLDYLNFDNQVSYVNSANKVVVPEVFLQSPLFHPGFPNSVNLGLFTYFSYLFTFWQLFIHFLTAVCLHISAICLQYGSCLFTF